MVDSQFTKVISPRHTEDAHEDAAVQLTRTVPGMSRRDEDGTTRKEDLT